MTGAQDDFVAVDEALDRRLRDWGRWARQRAWMSACRSIEGRYRPEGVLAGGKDDPRPMPVDALDAWAVESAWRGLADPRHPAHLMRERMLLRGYYVVIPGGHREAHAWQAHIRALCRRLGVPRRAWAYEVTRAIGILNNRLRKAQHGPIIPAGITPARDVVRDATAALAVSASLEAEAA